MQFHGFVLWRFQDGKIAERWATVTPPAEEASWTSWNAAPQSVVGKKAKLDGEAANAPKQLGERWLVHHYT